ncbi:type II secretion system protein [Marinobacteraceae bacterium S3BR75-40.1]
MPRNLVQQGFTLVELVTVMILIGIVSALGIGLFASKSSYTSLTARDLLLSTALLAQQRALSNPDSANAVTLTISQSSGQWTFSLAQGATWSTARTAEKDSSATLTIGGTTLANGGSQTLTYSAEADLGSNTQVVFQSGSSHRLCIASTGFPYTGSCQP